MYGPHSENFKLIYGTKNPEEAAEKKRLFQCALHYYFLQHGTNDKKQVAKDEEEHTVLRDRVMQEDYETSRTAAAAIKKAKEADVLITKTIKECKALIARYYGAIEKFDNHMLSIRDREIRREKAANSLFPGVEGKPKSKLHQLYLQQAKSKQIEAPKKESVKPVQTQ